MSTADNKRLILDSIETMWGQKDLDAYLGYLAPVFVDHTDRTRAAGGSGAAEFLRTIRALLGAFPDMTCTVEDVVAEGDRVATRWTLAGTHTGRELGILPTGRHVSFRGGAIERLDAGGKIVERWSYSEDVHLLAQLGVLKRPEGAPKV